MKVAGIWALITGVCCFVVGGFFAMLALSEASRYADLVSAGNPFADVASNSFIYLAGIGALGIFAGVGLILVGAALQSMPGGSPTQRGKHVWDGEKWVVPTP